MDDLISEFITETTESLSVLDQQLVKLEQNPEDVEILGNIFRVMHTIKGTCGFLGLPRLEQVAHASENVLGKIRDKKLTASAQAISLVLTSLDNIKALIDYLNEHGKEPEGSDEEIIARLNRFADTGVVDGDVSSPPASAPVPETAPGDMDFSSFFKGDDELSALLAEQGNEHSAPAHASPEETPPQKLAIVEKESEAPRPAPAAPAAVAKVPAEQGEKSEGGGATQSIRVNLDVLENLMQMVSELVLTRNQLMQILRTREDRDFLAPIQHLSHITTELQEGIMKTRMQPIGNAWSKFPRLVRDLSLELGKKIELKMLGAETELDRQLLEMIKDPLTHMVRNSCDHGLEGPADRAKAGKPECGTVTLSAYHEGGHIIVDIIDDGRGINIDRVKEKAVANGLAAAADLEGMNEKQIMQFIFKPGFSTAEKVTSVSGRGVGMDVVRTNIEKIGGTIDLDSTYGRGSKISVKIPLTLAIVSVLIVESGGQKFAIPQINVLELVRVSAGGEYKVESINGAPVMRLREKLLPLGALGEILGLQQLTTNWVGKDAFVVVCRVGGYDFGLLVDRVYDTEEIVVKPVADVLKNIAVFSGNTILGDGSVIMILDPNGVAKSIGDSDLGTRQQENIHEKNNVGTGERLVSFLLFDCGKGAPKAVPLELVSRLEEIDVKDIEIAVDAPVVQYRGDLMRLIMLGDAMQLPNEGIIQVIVFNYDKKTVGLVVQNIIDIMHAPYDVRLGSSDKNCLGSMVIAGKTTDVIDVSQILAEVVGVPLVGQSRIEPCTLLLVEDSLFFRNLTEPFLAAAGYDVTPVESGVEALKLISSHPKRFRAIVTDIEMPGMNGFEFTAACRAIPQLASTPIIAYTSSVSEEVLRKGREAGVHECIVKTDRPGLLQSIARHLASEKELAA